MYVPLITNMQEWLYMVTYKLKLIIIIKWLCKLNIFLFSDKAPFYEILYILFP